MKRWCAAAALILLVCGCKKPGYEATGMVPVESTRTAGKPWFVDVTGPSKVDFSHHAPASKDLYIIDNMNGGLGWIDFDNDGLIDLFCVQGGNIDGAPSSPAPTHAFYRNNGDGTFSNVTQQVGLNAGGLGMGCAVGDFNNDGFDDLVVTYYRGLTLFQNVADGNGRKFVDVSKQAGLASNRWSTSCGWGDIDGDGFLDLYVCNYLDFDPKTHKPCTNQQLNETVDCPPTVYPYSQHFLFRNNGNGTFSDISESSGIVLPRPGAGLAVGLADLDDDGKIDIYVANDMQSAHVWHNQGGGKFKNVGAYSGASLMGGGRFMAGMGVGIGDVDESGLPSIIVSNYQDEPTMLFQNRGQMIFRDWNHQSGLGPATAKTLGFGLDFLDADLDGNLDVVLVNGHVVRHAKSRGAASYQQQAQLFVGDGKARFTEVTETAGPYFREKHLGRGVAVGDYDNDGKPDLAISNNGGPAKLLRNETETANRWLRLDLVGDGKKSNRNAIGAKVEIAIGNRKLTRWVIGGGSYLSAADRRVLVGLGNADSADKVVVTWPSGVKQTFGPLQANHGYRLTEGQEKPAHAK